MHQVSFNARLPEQTGKFSVGVEPYTFNARHEYREVQVGLDVAQDARLTGGTFDECIVEPGSEEYLKVLSVQPEVIRILIKKPYENWAAKYSVRMTFKIDGQPVGVLFDPQITNTSD